MFVDFLILIFAVGSFYRGRELGLARQLFAAGGFIGGLFLGIYLQPYAAKLASNPVDHTLITLSCTLGIAIIGLLLGEAMGIALKGKITLRHFNHLDSYLGSLINIVTLLIGAWLLAALVTTLPIPAARQAVQGSKIVTGMNSVLPSASQLLTNIGKLIDPNGFPQVFIGTEPAPRGNVDLPSLGELRQAVESTQASVVKVEGIGCGGIVNGSGFVVGDNLIATNAHVVAGIKQPYFADRKGTFKASTVYFDPKLDFALLRSTEISAEPIPISPDKAPIGTPGAVLGYPGGEGFSADPAVIMNTLYARGRDIYGNSLITREIYELRADVAQGNSGGPVINKAGEVIGVIFAESTSYEQVGYAFISPSIVETVAKYQSATKNVSTGQCAQD